MMVNNVYVGTQMQLSRISGVTGECTDNEAFPMLGMVLMAEEADEGQVFLNPKEVKALLAELEPFKEDQWVAGFINAFTDNYLMKE